MKRSSARIALLRAVNLPSHQTLRMAQLREFFDAIGYPDAQTLLQSGNVVFQSADPPTRLEARLEGEAAKRLDLHTEFFVRSLADLETAIAANPLGDMARDDPGHLVVLFLKAAPARERLAALRAAIKGRETVHAVGTHAYVAYPDGIGDSKLTMAVIERHLGTRGTGRNWNTVQKLAALAGTATGGV